MSTIQEKIQELIDSSNLSEEDILQIIKEKGNQASYLARRTFENKLDQVIHDHSIRAINTVVSGSKLESIVKDHLDNHLNKKLEEIIKDLVYNYIEKEVTEQKELIENAVNDYIKNLVVVSDHRLDKLEDAEQELKKLLQDDLT